MKRANLKNNNSKKKRKKLLIKFIFLILIVFFSYNLTLRYLVSKKLDLTDKKYVEYLLDKGYKKDNKYTFITSESLKLFSDIDLKKPSSMLEKKIKKVNNTTINNNSNSKKMVKDAKAKEDDYDLSTYEKLTTYISNPNDNEVKDPIVYIYNTHQLETYSNNGLENANITPNVMMASYLLADKLNKNGVSAIAEDNNISEFIKAANLTDTEPYSVTRIFFKNALSTYSSLKYFIDIHRDSIDKSISTCTIGDKNYARILFVIGTTNENYEKNEKIAREIDDVSDKMYSCLSRGIYKRATPNWKPAYNQDLSGNAMLIEIGAKENTMEEVLNTVDALGEVLTKYIKGE